MSIHEPNLRAFGEPLYLLSPDQATNARISAVLNEAAHVFMWHAEGLWKAEYKDGFARLLVSDLRAHPKLVKSIVGLGDRVFSMVAYRAAELVNEEPGA
jgi:hypothetical protein